GDPLAGRGCRFERHHALLEDVVGGVALQPADGDRPVLVTEHAGADTEFVHRADTAAGMTYEVRLEDGDAGTQDVIGSDLADEGGDVDVGRAGLDARSVEAVKTTVGLDVSLVRRVGGIGLGERIL